MGIFIWIFLQNHWFTYNETMTVESVTQAVSNLALQFGEEDADPGAMVGLGGLGGLGSPLSPCLTHPLLCPAVPPVRCRSALRRGG